MRRKINRQLITIAILATVVTMALITVVFRQLLQQQIMEDLKAYAGLLDKADLYQNTEIYVTDFKAENVRITWIDADGEVLAHFGFTAKIESDPIIHRQRQCPGYMGIVLRLIPFAGTFDLFVPEVIGQTNMPKAVFTGIPQKILGGLFRMPGAAGQLRM